MPRTGLFSCSGSGNTWLRYLIQKSTGYITGVDHLGSGLSYFLNKTSAQRFIQDNTTLYTNGYPGELISDGSAIGNKHAFKTLDFAHWIRMNYVLTD